MAIEPATIKKIGHLARLRIQEDEISKWQQDLNSILSWIEQLEEVDTNNTEPLLSVHETPLPRRKDVVTDGDCPHAILANAPQTAFDMFVVPKVVE